MGVKSLMLLNATCDGLADMNKVIDYVSKLRNLDGVVITNPMYIPELKNLGLEIQSSVNCYVKTVEQARDLKEMGVDVITIDRDINRDLELIKEIKSVGIKLKALVNEGCLRNCPFRKIHFNLISHDIDTIDFDKRSCITVLRRHPEKVFQIPFIRPEDLKYYKDIDYFKIATRTMDTIKIGIILDAYVNQKFEGDLLFLLSGKGIFEYFAEIDNRILSENDFLNRALKDDFKGLLEKAAVRIDADSDKL